MKATNPVLSRLAEAARDTLSTSSARGDVMTRAGTAGKSLILLALAVFSASFTWTQVAGGNTGIVMPSLLVGGLGGFIVAMIVSFKPNTAPVAAPIYAVLEGLLLGAISALYNLRYAGVPQQAVLLTFAVALGVFTLYRMNILKATEGFRRMIVGATIGIAVFYLVNLVLSLFNVNLGYSMSSSPIAIGINLVIAGVAAMNLVLNFDDIDQAVRMGAPKKMEWYGAFGLMVTLVWLYLELLRLLARLQGRRD
ncbi:MAG: Bax inhibitor-1/YccA family protein [Gemmatimonadaceae bacterium]|nr:Bax inhibitor-1/YccA family protein [Gemmatimonadaceae bacterium]